MRPELCRLCEKPAADGGYRAAELDKEKLAEWCLNYLGTTLAKEVKDDDLFCYFCIWDARILYENDTRIVNGCNNQINYCKIKWWPEQETGKSANDLFQNYKAGNVQQCWVSLKQAKDQKRIRSYNTGKKDSTEIFRTCCYCGKDIPAKSWKTHMKKKHADISIRCNFSSMCCMYFHNVEERDAHVKEIHFKPKNEVLYDCMYCPLKQLKVWTYKKHLKSKHRDVAIRCSFRWCHRYFKSRDDMNAHLETYHKSREENKKFKCSFCNYKAHSRPAVAQHEFKNHKKGEKNFKCSNCAEKFSCKMSRKQHMYSAHILRACPACDLQIQASKFNQHFKKNSCRTCQTEFDCWGLCRKHERKCKPKFQCEICSKVFRIKSDLAYHMISNHLIQKKKGVKSRKTVNLPSMKLQLAKRPKFKCAHCSMEFLHRANLRRHLATVHNLIDKQHSCIQCLEIFYFASELRVHMNVAHSKEMTRCKICKFSTKSYSIKQHMIRAHLIA
ncbi:PR domain zinc finger protein 5-like [Neocloeon triangulifer]|uniref:PR domain zinc finger protein 5-like n=1 Tax=Neocloeon triangulifer TaxID=2078957 RepID=UPI00286F7F46|nr:PR domain zinc finger protein 5-like [Neocloeon triangulifer]